MARELLRVAAYGVLALALALGYATFRIVSQGERDERRPADAIVVLGAAQYNGRPSAQFAARLDHAVSLFLEGTAPLFVVTGGKRPGDRTTEAAVARAYAIERGVPKEAILAEDKGRTTLESLEAVGAILRARGLRSAVFVSDRPHMLRVLRIAQDEGITGWGSPTATSPLEHDPGRRAGAVAHELLGLAAYYVGASRLIDDEAAVSAR